MVEFRYYVFFDVAGKEGTTGRTGMAREPGMARETGMAKAARGTKGNAPADNNMNAALEQLIILLKF